MGAPGRALPEWVDFALSVRHYLGLSTPRSLPAGDGAIRPIGSCQGSSGAGRSACTGHGRHGSGPGSTGRRSPPASNVRNVAWMSFPPHHEPTATPGGHTGQSWGAIGTGWFRQPNSFERLSSHGAMAKPLVSDELWKVIEPLLPPEPPKPSDGRPRVPTEPRSRATCSSSGAASPGRCSHIRWTAAQA